MATFMQAILKIAKEYNAENEPQAEYKVRYMCAACHDREVKQQSDLCEWCAENRKRGYEAMMLAGRCANGFEADHGVKIHAVKFGVRAAMCGIKPGRRSVGWVYPYSDNKITCPRCLKKAQEARC